MSDAVAELVTCPRCDRRMTPAAGGDYSCECGVNCSAETARAPHVRQVYESARAARAVVESEGFPNLAELGALRRCFERAAGCSGGESRVRRLLFSWHNAAELGGFDIADLWSLGDDWRADVLTVIGMIARGPQGWYADRYGYGADMMALIEEFGPRPERERAR